MPRYESPKPYLHPLRTLDGALMSAYRPHDHRWHKGLQMTLTDLSGQNFWGGPTYVDGQGYVARDNNGAMVHDGFDVVRLDDGEVTLNERLRWYTSAGEHWVDELRSWHFHTIDAAGGSWALDFATELDNVRGAPLVLGSPTTSGRELAGYSGLFWRGPRGFTGGEVMSADGRTGWDCMGTTSPWLAYSGAHDEIEGGATMLMVEPPDNPPIHWFVRNDPFPAMNPSPCFFAEHTIPVGGTLRLRHRLVVAGARWDRGRIQDYVEEHPS